MLDFFRHLRLRDRLFTIPFAVLFPVFIAWALRDSIVTAHGPGAYSVTLVTAVVAAALGALVVHRHYETYPATITLGVMCLYAAELIFVVSSWDRLAVISTFFAHSVLLTIIYVAYLEKKWEAERAAERAVDDAELERAGGVRFSMQDCGDSACFCQTTKADYVLRA